ncbi:hypothetical protein BAG01nite_08790 [Brevibacillus agri]|uniref:HTH domain-containing protein n=1 Tax=Brevibacillus agri TaxID=51101 RepID=A0A3M8AC24_9BACL|nr:MULTISPECIES: HTH domain-containing protein [Brevibacillus]ELK39738.1 transcriptional regulator [Brevibacillus agri BAB-2500]MBY0051698.1 HTH domain-containing protein [Brevibacillus agri]MCG5252174.1 HTH domain-containing protein [Brevibacillus agri]MDN4091264.1 HTH domain-containing protein [Brevibacillus agri]MDR9503776.1 HTH domain-containing protein [Brevibacillus agri]
MKVERLLAIVMMLLNKRRMSARELADRFEVSLRTACPRPGTRHV